MKKKYKFYFFLIIVLILLSIEFMKYFGIFPSHRLAQVYWHMTNESVIENENIKLKLPIKWILAKETSNQYFLHGDYIDKSILKTIIIQKKALAEENIVSGFDKNCLIKQKISKTYDINEKIFQLYRCEKLKKGGSIAFIFDDSFKFNMIIYDYEISDTTDIIELLNALRIK